MDNKSFKKTPTKLNVYDYFFIQISYVIQRKRLRLSVCERSVSMLVLWNRLFNTNDGTDL
jgi:hypothetical protein